MALLLNMLPLIGAANVGAGGHELLRFRCLSFECVPVKHMNYIKQCACVCSC